jgi:hypothetical protein
VTAGRGHGHHAAREAAVKRNSPRLVLTGEQLDKVDDHVRQRNAVLNVLTDPFVNAPWITLVVKLVSAGAEAVLRVVARRRKKQLADRLRRWLRDLLIEYKWRCADPREGGERAWAWLSHELETGPPRQPKTEDEDARIVRLAEELRLRLALVFARFPRATAARDSQVRPIAEKVLGRRLTSCLTECPHDALDNFVPALLEHQMGYTIVRRSKAARRYRSRHADALISYTERRLRTALRADDAALAAVGATRAGLQKELSDLRQNIAALRTPRRPERKAR